RFTAPAQATPALAASGRPDPFRDPSATVVNGRLSGTCFQSQDEAKSPFWIESVALQTPVARPLHIPPAVRLNSFSKKPLHSRAKSRARRREHQSMSIENPVAAFG